MKRKGQSEIITTILLILIVLAAVVVVWMVISRFLNSGSSADCAKVQMRIVSADAATDTVSVNRMAGSPEVRVTGLKILVNGVAAQTVTVQDIGELETKGYVTSGTGGNFTTGDRIQVAPIIQTVGGQPATCQVVGETRAV